jgi:glycosyltransferase involved in cell wall biosynthesis
MRFKVVVTLHDYFIACPNGGFMDYPAASICKRKPLSWKCIKRNCDARCFTHKIWRTGRTLLQNKILGLPERVDRYVTVSTFCAKILLPYLPDKVKLDSLSNPIDVPPCSPSDVATNDKFFFVGRFSREKGSLTFAKAAAQLNISAVFVGDGYLKKKIQRIYPQAEFTGWLSREKVREQMNRARALIFPSIWYETQGLVVVESAAQGVPVVTSDTSATIDFIEDQKTGLYFKTGDVDDLRAKLNMLKNGDFAAELGRAAYEKYWKNPWSIDKHTRELISIYQEVLNS